MSQVYDTARYAKMMAETFALVEELGKVKGGEYAAEGDRLDNFRRNAKNWGVSMETCWGIYIGKHWDAIQTYVRDVQNGRTRVRAEKLSSRVDDMITYLILFKCMLDERENPPKQPTSTEAITATYRMRLDEAHKGVDA